MMNGELLRPTRLLVAALGLLLLAACGESAPQRILVFSKTSGWRHESIPAAHETIRSLATEMGFVADSTEDSATFSDENLSKYDAVVFALTTEDVLDDDQQAAFERYIRNGGAYVGIHAASDTEYEWEWYGKLVGGYFDGHPSDPNVRVGRLVVEDAYHSSTSHLRFQWDKVDEWYDIRDRNPDVNVLLSIVDSTYKEEWDEETHPMAWYHHFDGGRAFYTALGHTVESYSEPEFVGHLRGGIEYALGRSRLIEQPPPESAFRREILVDSLNEPMELEVLPDGRVMFVERCQGGCGIGDGEDVQQSDAECG